MKKSSKNILLAAALLSVPLSVYAVVNDTTLQITNTGYIGGASLFSGSVGYNLSVGQNNLFTDSFYNANIGTSLRNSTSNSLVVGYYNLSTAGNLLVVGNGTYDQYYDGDRRRNAFEVSSTGNVNIPITTPGAKITIGNNYDTSAATITTKIYGTADITRVPAKGGISMGAYTAQ